MIRKIVLTGGPCGGKSTVLAHIQERFTALGFNVLIVPESATTLFLGGFSCNKNDSASLLYFQEAQMSLQLHLECLYHHQAERTLNNTLIICDRGTMDARAFCNDSVWNNILEFFATDNEKLQNRYDAVIHLETAAKTKGYTLENNKARKETPKEAIELDERIKSAWVGTPHLRVIPANDDFNTKIKQVLKCIGNLVGTPLPLEIERKFLLKTYPKVLPVESSESKVLQYYLIPTEKDSEERVRERKSGEHTVYTHCIKRRLTDGTRVEQEQIVSHKDFVSLLNHRDWNTNVIYKSRRCFLYQNQYFELDVFEFPNKGRAVLEVELDDINAPLSLPDFLEIEKEVTSDIKYSNFYMASSNF
jgi:CYTH domain-containing protein/thymidylate kinase